jgi:hypothetical protein
MDMRSLPSIDRRLTPRPEGVDKHLVRQRRARVMVKLRA